MSQLTDITLEHSHYDLILLGTGLTPTLLAAAAAKKGKKVLHLDSHDCYGSATATLNLQEARNWIQKHAAQSNDEEKTDKASGEENKRKLEEEGKEAVRKYDEKKKSNLEKLATKKAAAEATATLPAAPADVPTSGEAAASSSSTPPAAESTDGEVGSTAISDRFTSTAVDVSRLHFLVPSNRDCYDGASIFQPQHQQPQQQEAKLEAESGAASSASTESSEASTTASAAPSIPTFETLLPSSRRFQLDLSPHLIYSRTPLVELLISSNVGSYLEFKSLDHCYLYLSDKTNGGNGEAKEIGITEFPMSRSGVFQSDLLSMMEKRQLMKLMQLILGSEKVDAEHITQQQQELAAYHTQPFSSFLSSRSLSPRLSLFLTYSVALLPSSSSSILTSIFLSRLTSFLSSLGRYGTQGAFLATMYGTSEIPQAFTRLCAINEGVYILRFGPKAIVVEEEEVTASKLNAEEGQKKQKKYRGIITAAGQFVTSDAIVVEQDYLPADVKADLATASSTSSSSLQSPFDESGVYRCICITDAPLACSSSPSISLSADLSLLVLPPGSASNADAVRVIQCNENVGASPRGYYVLYVSMPQRRGDGNSRTAEEALKPALQLLLNCGSDVASSSTASTSSPASSKPHLLWSCFYHQQLRSPSPSLSSISSLHIVSDPSPDVSLDCCVDEAGRLFEQLYGKEAGTVEEACKYVNPKGQDPEQEELEQLDILDDLDKNSNKAKGSSSDSQTATATAEASDPTARASSDSTSTSSHTAASSAPPDATPAAATAPPARSSAEAAVMDSLDDLSFD